MFAGSRVGYVKNGTVMLVRLLWVFEVVSTFLQLELLDEACRMIERRERRPDLILRSHRNQDSRGGSWVVHAVALFPLFLAWPTNELLNLSSAAVSDHETSRWRRLAPFS